MTCSNGYDPRWNPLDQNGSNLYKAWKERDIDEVKRLIESGVNINLVSHTGETILHQACWHGEIDFVILLINMGADIEAENMKKYTPLLFAGLTHNFDVAEYLIKKGANMSKRSLDEWDFWRCVIDDPCFDIYDENTLIKMKELLRAKKVERVEKKFSDLNEECDRLDNIESHQKENKKLTDDEKLKFYEILDDIFHEHDFIGSEERGIYVINKMEEELSVISFYEFTKRFEEINEIFSNLNEEWYELKRKQRVEKELSDSLSKLKEETQKIFDHDKSPDLTETNPLLDKLNAFKKTAQSDYLQRLVQERKDAHPNYEQDLKDHAEKLKNSMESLKALKVPEGTAFPTLHIHNYISISGQDNPLDHHEKLKYDKSILDCIEERVKKLSFTPDYFYWEIREWDYDGWKPTDTSKYILLDGDTNLKLYEVKRMINDFSRQPENHSKIIEIKITAKLGDYSDYNCPPLHEETFTYLYNPAKQRLREYR